MDFQSAMETFAEAWIVAKTGATQTQALALTRPKSPKHEPTSSPSTPPPPPSSSLLIYDQKLSSDRYNQSTPKLESSSPQNLLINSAAAAIMTQQSNNCAEDTKILKSPSIDLSTNEVQLKLENSSPINHNHPHAVAAHHQQQQQHQQHSSHSHLHHNRDRYSSGQQSGGGGGGAVNNFLTANHQIKFNNAPSGVSGGNKVCNENGIGNGGGGNGGAGGTVNISTNQTDKEFEKILPSPTEFSKINSKSLPLHCVVESFPSLQASISIDNRTSWKRRSNIEIDSYVIIPSATPFSDIVKTAIQSLGYTPDIANTAKGTILIKNWKPLPLEKVTDSPLITVGEILGELTSVVTLRISVIRTKPSLLNDIKDKLLKLLILQSHAVLRSTGCPLDEIVLTQICRNQFPSTFPFEVSDDLKKRFDQWWNNQLSPQSNPIATKILPSFVTSPSAAPQNDFDFSMRHLHSARGGVSDGAVIGGVPHEGPRGPHHNLIVHPALQTVHSHYPNQKTRMRTSFDPEMELPKLQKWFQDNPHPSRQQIQSYVIALNSLESRRGRKPLDVNNVVYWFKNARAAQKRAELRSNGMENGYASSGGLLMSHSDFLKSPHSIPSEDIDNVSQHSDDMDDDVDRPMTPEVPLSLTIHERNRSPINLDVTKTDNEHSNSSPTNNNNCIPNNSSRDDDSSHVNHNNPSNNDSPKTSAASEDLDMDDTDMISNDFRSPSPDSRRDVNFPLVPNSMFSHSIMYMSHYIPTAMGGQGHHGIGDGNANALGASGGLNLSNDERRKRNRTFIDPVTEVPKLEQWFAINTHPSHNLILKYTEDLNRMPYRQKFPRLESKNVQFWFKNRRAKCKRLKMSLYDNPQMPVLSAYHQNDRE